MQETRELVELAKARDQLAIAALVERYQHTAVVAAWAILGDFHAAQDVTQDAFVDAFRTLSRLRNPDAFAAWLLTGVRRRSIRARKTKRPVTGGLEMAEMIEASQGSAPEWFSKFEELVAMFAQLPEHERDAISLRYLSDLSVKQIAAELDRPIGTVTKQLSRAISRLQKLASEGVEP